MVVVNFANVNSLIPAGDYHCTLTKATAKKTKPTDGSAPKDMILFQATINDPDYPDLQGKNVFANYVIMDTTLWKFQEGLLAFGADPEEVAGEIDDVMEFCAGLYGNGAIAHVEVVPHYKDASKEQNQTDFKMVDF